MPILEPSVALERLKSTPRELVALVGTAKADLMHRSPDGDADEWSPATVLSHLADAELVYSVRIRMALTADRPYLAAYDEQAWVRRFAELDVDPKETLGRWRGPPGAHPPPPRAPGAGGGGVGGPPARRGGG